MDLDLSGRRALVTAGSRGIGAAVARVLAAEGCDLLVHGRDASAAQAVADEIGAEVVLGDLTDAEDAARVASAATGWGAEIVVNNLGPFAEHTWEDAEPGVWAESYDGNVVSLVRLLRPMLPALTARGWGRVVMVGSRAATTPLPTMVEYSAAKAAVVNLTSSLARHLGGTGVTANVVSPGVTGTDGLWAMLEARAQETATDLGEVAAAYAPNPAGRLGTPDDVAAAVAFLCSPRAAYVNGTELRVDGGLSPLA